MKKIKKFGTFIVLLLCMSFIFIGCDQSIQNNEEDENTATASEKEAFVGAVEDFVETGEMSGITNDTPIRIPSTTVIEDITDLDFDDLLESLVGSMIADTLDDDFEYTFKDEDDENTSYKFALTTYEVENIDGFIDFIKNRGDGDASNNEDIEYYITEDINPKCEFAFKITDDLEEILSGRLQFDVEITATENEDTSESASEYIYSIQVNSVDIEFNVLADTADAMSVSVEINETKVLSEETLDGVEDLELDGDISDLRNAVNNYKTAIWGDTNPLTLSLTASTNDGEIIYEFTFDEIVDIAFECLENVVDNDD